MKNWHKKYTKMSCLNKIYIDLEKAKYYFVEITDLCQGALGVNSPYEDALHPVP
jgi:hypothetical protein